MSASTIASSLPGTNANSSTTNATGNDAYSSLSSEQFVKIMMSELSNQDPLKPNDSSQLIQEVANLRSIESNMDLSKKMQNLVSQNQLASAGNLIGQYVFGYTADFQPVQDYVVSISKTDSGPVLNLRSGWQVPFDNIAEITSAAMIDPAPGTGTGDQSGGGTTP